MRLLIVFALTLWTCSVKADGYVTYLYQVKIELKHNRIVDGYFIDVDHPQTKEFKNQKELKDFLIQKTKNKTGEIDKLYKSLFRILDFPTVDNWVKGHILFSKCEQLKISEKEIVTVTLVSSSQIPSQVIDNLSDTEVSYLTKEPRNILSLDLEDKVREFGDGYLTYTLISYSLDKDADLEKIKKDIEAEYFTESKNSRDIDKMRIWKRIFHKYKDQLLRTDILFIEVSEF